MKKFNTAINRYYNTNYENLIFQKINTSKYYDSSFPITRL